MCSITFFIAVKIYCWQCSREYIECIEHIPEHARIHFKLYKYMIQIHCGTCSDSNLSIFILAGVWIPIGSSIWRFCVIVSFRGLEGIAFVHLVAWAAQMCQRG